MVTGHSAILRPGRLAVHAGASHRTAPVCLCPRVLRSQQHTKWAGERATPGGFVLRGVIADMGGMPRVITNGAISQESGGGMGRGLNPSPLWRSHRHTCPK